MFHVAVILPEKLLAHILSIALEHAALMQSRTPGYNFSTTEAG